jgi:hypothetical protein
MTDVRGAEAATDEGLRTRFAQLEAEHRGTLARRPTVPLGSEEYVAIQRALGALEVEMNLISGILAERAGRGHVAVRGRD